MDATSAFKTVLEQSGYKNVRIQKMVPPQHVVDWARGDDEEMTAEDVGEVNPYFKVTSSEVSFGIIMGPYNLIDVKGTGLNAKDLGEKEESDDPFIVPLNTTTLKLLRLKSLLKTTAN